MIELGHLFKNLDDSFKKGITSFSIEISDKEIPNGYKPSTYFVNLQDTASVNNYSLEVSEKSNLSLTCLTQSRISEQQFPGDKKYVLMFRRKK